MPDLFTRGTAVFEYWLAHPEGLTVRPLNARVEHAVGAAPFGPASAVVVRAPSGRTRRIPAHRLVAVDPAKAELFLDGAGGNDPVHDRVVRAAAWTAPRVRTGARAFGRAVAVSARWLAPRARAAAILAARRTHAGARWLTPRVVAGCRRGAGYVRSTTIVASRGITPKR
jgi:hypothetical protein